MPPSTTTRHGSSFGSLLRECRKRTGLSQHQLADYLAESPKRISKWETGASDPPQDPAFYDRVQAVPGFSDTEITLLREAAKADESTNNLLKRRALSEGDQVFLDDSVLTLIEDFAQKVIKEKEKTQQKIAEAIQKNLKIREAEAKFGAPGAAGIAVRREGLLRRENPQERKRYEALKANRDREILTAHHLKNLGGCATSGQKYVMDVIERLKEDTAYRPEELQPIGQLLTNASTKVLTASYAECLKFLAERGFQEIDQATEPATKATLPTIEEDAQALSPESFTYVDVDAIITSSMKPKEAEGGEQLPYPSPDPQPQGDPSTVQGTKPIERVLEQPSSELEQQQRVPKKDVVYKRKSRSHYGREYLRDNGGNVTRRLVAAVENNDPVLRPLAEQALQSIHLFAEAEAKVQGASLSQVSREQQIPLSRLSDIVRKKLVPTLYKDSKTVYLANKTAEELGRDNQDAIEMDMQLARLLRERQAKHFPRETNF